MKFPCDSSFPWQEGDERVTKDIAVFSVEPPVSHRKVIKIKYVLMLTHNIPFYNNEDFELNEMKCNYYQVIIKNKSDHNYLMPIC